MVICWKLNPLVSIVMETGCGLIISLLLWQYLVCVASPVFCKAVISCFGCVLLLEALMLTLTLKLTLNPKLTLTLSLTLGHTHTHTPV